jgi:alcohol dehydrogenase (cytochrome c)
MNQFARRTLQASSLALAAALAATPAALAQAPAAATPAAAASQAGNATFTAAQADAGTKTYQERCVKCHGEHLDDGEFGLPLRGKSFMSRWAGHAVSDLYNYMRQSMPVDGPGTLGEASYAQLTALVLSRNGIAAGASELPVDTKLLAAQFLPGVRLQPDAPRGGPSGGLAPGSVLPVWRTAASPLNNLTPVDEAMLAHPAAQDWLTWRHDSSSTGFSPLKQVSKYNVKSLHSAWTLALPAGPNEATPIVHDGVMFLHAYGDHVLALNAASGDVLWHYARQLPQGTNSSVMRNIALYGDRIYMGTSDSHVVALDAKTGTVVWDVPAGDPKVYRVGGGPLVAQGKVMQGVISRAPGGAYILGLDAATGKELWKFHSIAQPGDPGDSSWNDTPLEKRNGGSVWVAGSYDPDLKLAFYGIAQTYDTAPLQHLVKKKGITNDGLYLDSTVALDPETGKRVWHYQHLPNDQWDYDFVFERQLFSLTVDGKEKKMVVTGGKPAIYDAVDATSGKYGFSVDMGIQNFITKIDPKTGLKSIDPARYPDGKKQLMVCPHAGGAKSWLPGSLDPDSKVVFATMVESCMELIPVGEGERGSLSTGFRWALRPMPGSDGRYGRLQAFDLATRKTVWTVREHAPMTSGALATAGGVVFAGTLDRFIRAYDTTDGTELWSTRLGDAPSSAPMTYSVNGKQYIAIVTGFGGAQSATFPALVPDIKLTPTASSSVAVFELP